MKKYFLLILTFLIMPAFYMLVQAQNKTMTWTTKSEEARKLAGQGADHMMNIEFAQAYNYFQASLKLDPNFTIPLVFMTNLTNGEVQKSYAMRALKSTAGKTEGEKLFATLVEKDATAETRRAIWEKLYKMFPDGGMIGTYYVFTRATPDEQFSAAEEYIKKFPTKPWMYNIIAYYYLNQKKDNVKAKEYFEKYISMYPDGCNPYDSMGEYYFNIGDMENSERYYNMSLEKYPFNISSIDKLKEINDKKPKKAETK